MNKKIYIGSVKEEEERREPMIRLDIEVKEKREKKTLSICGEIGRDHGGQCQDSIRDLMTRDAINYQEGWNAEKLAEILDIWDVWHLNDMHAECEHQAKDGTLEEARKDVTIYGHKLGMDTVKQQDQLKEEIMEKLLKGESVKLDAGQMELLKFEYSVKSLLPKIPGNYKEEKDGYFGTKTERAGWVRFEEYPTVGILGKPCKTCGYKYGTAWNYVAIPGDVLATIEKLGNE